MAYKQSQKIYFETDMQKAKSPEFGQRFAQEMTLPKNGTLKDILSADNWAALQTFAEKSQYPLGQTMMFNAAMNSILITITEGKKLGVGDGVEAFYDAAARADNKPTGELETSDDVLAYMKKFAQEDPNKVIESTLQDIESMPVELDKMIANWKDGDLNALEKSFSERIRKETPKVYQALVVERNEKWMAQIDRLIKTPEVEMILVGSLHLPGSDGLLYKLKKAGYKTKPYSPK